MEEEKSLFEIQKLWHGTYKAYTIGFIGSLLLTALSFFLVMSHLLKGWMLFAAIFILALLQGAIQLRFFLHVGEEEKPRWEMSVFFFMVLVLLIVVVGTVWIMYDLDNRMMTMMHD